MRVADIERWLGGRAPLFHDPEGNAYATVPVGDHDETWRLRSGGFRSWLARLYWEMEGAIPRAGAIQDALTALEGLARFDGPEIVVHLRHAHLDGALYVDLGDPAWRAIDRRGLADGRRPACQVPADARDAGPPGARGGPKPGMADFAVWVIVGEPAIDWPDGPFLAAYTRNRAAAHELALESASIVPLLLRLPTEWEGTAGELLEQLLPLAGEKVTARVARSQVGVMSSLVRWTA